MKKNSFDKETRQKIAKSFVLSTLSALTAGVTAYSQGVDAQRAIWVGVSTYLTFLVNVVREYIAGDEVSGA